MRYLLTVVMAFFLFACENKKAATGERPKALDEFYDAYETLKLPFSVVDTNMAAISDTNTISYPLFTQFVPDSIFNNPFGKDRKLSIHPIGKIEQKGKESYFATLVKSKNQRAVYLSVFDSGRFTVNMPLVISNTDDIVQSASINKKLTIVINHEWTAKNNIYYDRTIYAYNNVGLFTTVLTETNVARNIDKGITNPLDTFPKKNKYSGDYAKGSKNLLFIRDGKTPHEYLFYVHFTNDNKEDPCGGELKGMLKMVSDKAGTYTSNGDPCVLDFDFSGNQVKVKETGGCGNYRGIKCFFNDTYTKKKEPKAATKKNKA